MSGKGKGGGGGRGKGGGGKGKGKGKGKGGGRRKKGAADSSAAMLGSKAMRYSGIQGGLLGIATVIHLASVAVVAYFLGPAEFGRFGLLLFLSGLLSMLFNMGSKQGTLKRVFGTAGDDDEDEEEEKDEEGLVAGADRTSLGTGMVLTMLVSILGTALVTIFAGPIADGLLGPLSGPDDPNGRTLIILAGFVGGIASVFRLASLVLWLERRPGRHVASEVVRPILVLIGVVAGVAIGDDLESAMAGMLAGSVLALVVALFLLRGSYVFAFTFKEGGAIYRAGAHRIPIVLSMWTVQSADIFILSRFISAEELGVYHLATKLAMVVAFLPSGFRMGMRPLRKSLTFKTVQESYGKQIARGQELGYFLLLCISALVAIILLSQLLSRAVPGSYSDIAPLIPLVAAGLMGPSVMRSVSRAASIPNKRRHFIGAVIATAFIFIAVTVLLAPKIDAYAAPAGMLVAFGLSASYMLIRGQLGSEPAIIPKKMIAGALLAGAFCAGTYVLVDPGALVFQAALAIGLLLLYLSLPILTGIIPRRHIPALIGIAKSMGGRPVGRFHPRQAIRKLEDSDREALRLALVERRPVSEIADDLTARGLELPELSRSPGKRGRIQREAAMDLRMLAVVRRAAEKGGATVWLGEDGRRRNVERLESEITRFLFPEGTAAQRDALMRELLGSGIDGKDLLSLEAVVEGLGRVPKRFWREAAAKSE